MPYNTEWAGNDALQDWMGGGIKRGCRGAWGPRTREGRALRAYMGWGSHGVAGLGGVRPRRLQDWGAYGPGGNRTARHRVPTARGCLAPRPRGMGQLDSRAFGGGEDGVYGLPARVASGEEVAGGVRRWLLFGCSGARVLRCRWRPLYIVIPLWRVGVMTPPCHSKRPHAGLRD